MRKFLNVVGIIVLVLVLIVAIIAGINMFNSNRYASPGDSNPREKSSYETNEHVTAIEGDYLNGFHFTPAEQQHAGTVVVFGGSEGGPDYAKAEMLAEHGYEVLSLFFFGQPNQQAELVDVPLEFFQETEYYLGDGPVTVIGTSKGAELTANLAAHGSPIDNIVLYSPAEYTYQGLDFSGPESSSFTLDLLPLPYLSMRNAAPGASSTMLFNLMIGLPQSYRAIYESTVERSDNTEEAGIPIENFRGHGLLFAGEQDAMWQGDVAARNLASRNPRLQAHIYPDAGHAFAENITVFGKSWERMLGGTVEGNRQAKLKSDELLLEHLAKWHPEQH